MRTFVAFFFLLCGTLQAQHLELTSRLSVIGATEGFTVTPDTAIKSIDLYSGNTLVVKTGVGGVHSFSQRLDGWQGFYAEIWHTAGSFQRTDTVWAFVCTKAEAASIFKNEFVFQYASKTFPDSAITLPEYSVVLGYTHYTTLKTLVKYLNPILRK